GTSTATVSITVDPVNDAPVAADDSASATSGVETVITVLTNDSDVDGDMLSISAVGMASGGTAVANTDGTITYTADAGFSGTDTFTYTVEDGNGGSDTATVTVNVAPAPTGDIILLLVNADTDEVLGPIGADGIIDPSTLNGANFSVLAQFANPGQIASAGLQLNSGPVQIEGAEPYALFGDIGTDFSGAPVPDSPFTITVQGFSGDGGSGQVVVEQTFNLSVGPVPQVPPVAGDDSASTSTDQAVTVSVLDNDSDGNGDTLTITSVGPAGNGSAVANLDGTITYTPDTGFSGTDSFTYTVDDGNGGSDTANVLVVVEAPVAPMPADDTASTDTDSPVLIDVLANDGDPNLTITDVADPGNGMVVLQNGEILYTPADGFTGTDSFDYTVENSDGLTSTASVTVTVNEPAPEPTITLFLVDANTDTVVGPIAQNGTLDTTLLANGQSAIEARLTNGQGAESFVFQLDNATFHVENVEPYAMFQDFGGDFQAGQLPSDAFELTVQAFSGDNGQGNLIAEESYMLVNGSLVDTIM
nr:tandem-95 repeat protein [Paracoccaceae bacterium]